MTAKTEILSSALIRLLFQMRQGSIDGEQKAYDEQDSTVERTAMFQDIYEDIWNTLRQSINEEK